VELDNPAAIRKKTLEQQQKAAKAAVKKPETKLPHLQRIIKKRIALIPLFNILSIREITKRFMPKYSLTTADEL